MSHSPTSSHNDTINNERGLLKTEQDATSAPTATPPPYSRFTRRQRWLIVAIASISATFSGFASNIYFPAIPRIAHDLGSTIENINLTVTSYMIFQAITPTFWGALSDVYGRRVTLMCTFVVFIGAGIGLALSNHFYQLLILRCLQSSGSASTIAIGSGMIGDVTTREARGGVMGIFQTGLLMPLAIGPVLGGVFADTLGWRAIFWFLVIYAGCYLVLLVLLLPETLRHLVGDGAVLPPRISRAPLDRFTAPPRSEQAATAKPLKLDIVAPIRILFYPEVFVTLLFLSLHYGTWQMALTAQSSLFTTTYGLGDLHIGLTFLANGFGCMIGTLTTGKLLDHDYKRMKRKFTGNAVDFPIEHARLRTVWFWSPLQWFALLLFGWTLDKSVHMAAPIVASFVLAWAAMSIQSVISTYVVDVFPTQTASATAALNLARCLLGAGATASVEPTMKRIGTGWTFTLWTCLLVLSLALVGVQQRWGAVWRKRRESREQDKEGM
jgi:multidrug resistance protein